ncbi:MAG: phosphatase PAP2 family protein [Acidimicrobiales bacterium]
MTQVPQVTLAEAVPTPAPGSQPAPEPPTRSRLRWWREVLYVGLFYGVYTIVRNTQGSASVSRLHAFHNARRVISVERHLGMFHESAVQHALITHRGFIEFWNLFYGTFHFAVTIVALVACFRWLPERYPRLRNALAATTALALVGFALYPLMPPRLLHTVVAYHGPHFVDTLDRFGSLWSFDSGTMQKLSNQYAAMPSLHFAWSSWCACALVPALPRLWQKFLVLLYPLATLFAIVVTANHYVLDAIGGAVVLGLGYLIGSGLTMLWGRRHAARDLEAAS